ncbi:hypothetical protein N7486_001378 [Penicillium sp. IBT 16267x]|nr:hypothetical protein N7486_001378 [Penicillium sp. IBT 16267x]
MLHNFKFPGAANDHLYLLNYQHQQEGAPCEEGGCDPKQRIKRWVDEDDSFIVLHRGVLYMDQGRHTEAEAMYERALRGHEKALGPEHASTVKVVHNLGNLYRDQGRLAEAEAMYKRALQGYEKASEPVLTLWLEIASNLVLLYADQGRIAEAETMAERVVQELEKALERTILGWEADSDRLASQV